MRVKHFNGTVVDVPDKKANTLVSGGSWTFVDAPAEKLSDPVESAPQSDDTEEDVQEPVEASEVATIPEMREWARANGVQNVPAKGKLPRHAVEAYMNAHKE
jgi:hypothetical protein